MNTLHSVRILCTTLAMFVCLNSYSVEPIPQLNISPIDEGRSLTDFFRSALDFNPQLKIAEHNRDIGRSRARGATGQLLPQLSANASLSNNRRNALNQAQDFKGERYSLRLSQILFDWSAFSARDRARYQEDQFEQDYFATVGLLLLDIAEQYLNVVQAQDALKTTQLQVQAIENQLVQTQRLFDLQMVLVTDLYQVQANLAATQSDRIKLQSELIYEQEKLRSTSGLSVGQLYELKEGSKPAFSNRSEDEWIAFALNSNPQILSRKLAVSAATEHIAERKGEQLPQVNLILQRQNSDVGFDNAPQNSTDNTYLGLDISIPLYSGGSRRAAVREANSQKEIARNELLIAQLDVRQAVRTAYHQLASSELQIQAAHTLVESTRLSSRAMRRGFELGTVTSIDVLNALRDEFHAEIEFQKARYEQIRSLLILKQSAGDITSNDLRDIGELFQIER